MKTSQRSVVWFVVLFLFVAGNAARGDVFTVTNTNNSGPGSLHQAILDNNAHYSNGAMPDRIEFDIPAPAGPVAYTIYPTSADPLPPINMSVVIDGYTQSGASPNTNSLDTGTADLGTNAQIMIQIDGSSAGSSAAGLHVQAEGCQIYGLAINRFANTGSSGILVDGAYDTVVAGCFVGVDLTGTKTAGNKYGIWLLDASDNEIGGNTPESRNLIAAGGNTGGSIGVWLSGDGSYDNLVRGNQFGTDRDGLEPLAGPHYGKAIQISDGTSNTIGGTLNEHRNIIGGHNHGIFITGGDLNIVSKNYIGTNLNGQLDPHSDSIPNDQGIRIFSGSYNEIGGDVGNLIAHNGAGIIIVGDSQSNSITQNSITRNGGLGIDLDGEGNDVTLNDYLDADTGPNRLQNYPVIESATKHPAFPQTTVKGWLHSEPNKQYRLEFFAEPACDPVFFHGEGGTHLATVLVTTSFLGRADFTVALYGAGLGDVITATATHPDGSTSEFSECGPVKLGIFMDLGAVDWLDDGPGVSLLQLSLHNRSAALARNVSATLSSAAPWLAIPQANAQYGDIAPGQTVDGSPYGLDLSGWPGEPFWVQLDVAYEDEEGSTFHVMFDVELMGATSDVSLDPEPDAGLGLPRFAPNPFRTASNLSFELSRGGETRIDLFSPTGRRVRTLLDRALPAGLHQFPWDGRDDLGQPLTKGVYFYRMRSGRERVSGKVTLLR